MTTAIKIRRGDEVIDGRAIDLEACIVKSLGDGKRYEVIASFDSEDRDGDTIDQRGWQLGYFDAHPVLVDSHDYSSLDRQIGEFTDRDIKHNSLQGVVEYYTDQGNPRADWAAFLASKGRAAYSVGFIPLESAPRKGTNGGRRYTKQELLELSQVIVPSSREALQLMAKGVGVARDSLQARLARELISDFEIEYRRRKSWGGVALAENKWSSNFMGDSDGWGPTDVHCIVAGCDDAAQTNVQICSEHLKYLMNAAPEPPGSPPDDLDGPSLLRMSVLRGIKRVAKAGRTISSANMGKLHTALSALHDVHDATCDDADCPLDSEEGDDPTADKSAKAMNEGSGSEGGDITHPFTGTHTHSHSAGGDQGDDATHSHAHTHDGDGTHTDAEHVAAHKGASQDDNLSLKDANQSSTSTPPADTKSFEPERFYASLEDAMTTAIAALEAQ